VILLVRVDERLIHGQVVVAWGSILEPTDYVVVDDAIAASDWEPDLVLAGVPDDTRGEVVTVADAATAWDTWRQDAKRRIVLVQSVHTLVSLLDSGVAVGRANIGGLRRRPGRRQFLPYVQLDAAEIAACRRLCDAGVHLEGRDVPGTAPVDLCPQVGSER